MALSHWIWVPFGLLSFILVFFWSYLIGFGFLFAFSLLFWFCYGLISLDLGFFWPSLFYFGFVSA
jgi:hypothetical protein